MRDDIAAALAELEAVSDSSIRAALNAELDANRSKVEDAAPKELATLQASEASKQDAVHDAAQQEIALQPADAETINRLREQIAKLGPDTASSAESPPTSSATDHPSPQQERQQLYAQLRTLEAPFEQKVLAEATKWPSLATAITSFEAARSIALRAITEKGILPLARSWLNDKSGRTRLARDSQPLGLVALPDVSAGGRGPRRHESGACPLQPAAEARPGVARGAGGFRGRDPGQLPLA